jgi:hypothetical protein
MTITRFDLIDIYTDVQNALADRFPGFEFTIDKPPIELPADDASDRLVVANLHFRPIGGLVDMWQIDGVIDLDQLESMYVGKADVVEALYRTTLDGFAPIQTV